MSLSFPNLVLPTCVGWNYAKRSKYSTIVQDSQSGRHPAAATLQQSVIYEFELTYEFLATPGVSYADDFAYIEGFYESCRGRYGWFTFDPSILNLETMTVSWDLNAQRSGFSGLGDGSTTAFQLWRSSPAFGGGTLTLVEMIQNVRAAPLIYVNNSLVASSGYTISDFPAVVTFSTAPPLNATIAWDGGYTYLCRFAEDVLDADEFMYQLWELKTLKLETVLL